MYEKILAPLDGSDLCELVLPYVEELGERLGSEIILLHVCPPKLGTFSHKHEVYIQHMAEVMKEHLKGASKVEPVLLAGEPNKEIIDYAKKEDIGLVAMVTHGQSGIKRWMLGSTANKVVRETSKLVLIIRAGAPLAVREKGILNKVFVPLDGSELSEAIIPYVEALLSPVTAGPKPVVTLFHVIAPTHYVASGESVTSIPYDKPEIDKLRTLAESHLKGIARRLENKGIAVTWEVPVGNAAELIVDYAERSNANLTAMSTHGYSGFNRLFSGSVADGVLHHGNTPLLLEKPAEA